MLAEVILYVIIFLYGIVIGSFSNVLICRLPLKENIATHRSHCMTCGNKIQWYDLVPLVSYIILKGRCRHCGAKISAQYPLVEAINGFGYVFIFFNLGFSFVSILNCLLFTILLVITVIDWRTYEIPFGLNVTIGVLGLIKTLLDYPDLLLDHIIGFFAVSAFMLICLYIGRLIVGADCFGGGDIKLMAAAGLFLGWKENILAFLLGCILGAVIHSIRMKVSKEDHVLAFGPYLAAGIMIASLWGSRMIEWYMGLIF